MSSTSPHAAAAGRRLGSTLAALLVGLPLAALVLGLFHHGPLRTNYAFRYVEYPVQWVEVVFFCCGLGALVVKYLQLRVEQAACRIDILPRWDGKPMPAEKAGELMASVERQPTRVQGTYLGRRLRAAIEFLRQRKNAAQFDDQLRSLADADALAQENSFALVRFITWAIPILGFLGTVIGITGAIGGVTPEALEASLSMVTGGLAEAFDATALALGLTMVLMFLTFLIEKQEQSLLELVDRLLERQLGHRFQRDSIDTAPFIEAINKSTQALAGTVEGLVARQVELWAQALGDPERRAMTAYQHVQQQLTAALGQALDKTAEAYALRLQALEQQSLQQSAHLLQQIAGLAAAVRDTGREQQESLRQVAEGVGTQAAVLGKLQEDAANVVHLQAVLHQNLAALAASSSFEEAVHSLTAAVHLLTARTGVLSQGAPGAEHRAGPRLHQGHAA